MEVKESEGVKVDKVMVGSNNDQMIQEASSTINVRIVHFRSE